MFGVVPITEENGRKGISLLCPEKRNGKTGDDGSTYLVVVQTLLHRLPFCTSLNIVVQPACALRALELRRRRKLSSSTFRTVILLLDAPMDHKDKLQVQCVQTCGSWTTVRREIIAADSFEPMELDNMLADI